MSSPEKKRKSPSRKTKKRSLTPSPESTSNPSLPDDLVVNILARVSRSYHPNLSLVSKSFRSILASPELYQTRTLLGKTETFLYVCLRFPDEANPRWFTLYRKPNQNLTKKKKKKKKKKKEDSSVNLLAPTPILNSPHVEWARLIAVGSNLYAITAAIEDSPCSAPIPNHHSPSASLVAVGSNIYAIGGSIENAPSSRVSILDCRSHTWHEAPSMRMKRNYPAANVVDGKIYVAGGLEDFDSSKWMEVFDTKTQTWEFVLCPLAERFVYRSLVIDGEIYIFGDKVVTYKPKEDRWGDEGEHQSMDLGLYFHSYCVIDNVLYCYRPGGIKWYESEKRSWRKLRGLKGLSKLASSCVRLADYGGKIAIFWDKYSPSSGYKSHMITCAVISLGSCKNQGIRGKVEWFDDMLTVPSSYNFVGALAATL